MMLKRFGCFPGSSAGKESTCNAGDLGSIRGWGKSPRVGNGDEEKGTTEDEMARWHH